MYQSKCSKKAPLKKYGKLEGDMHMHMTSALFFCATSTYYLVSSTWYVHTCNVLLGNLHKKRTF